MAYKEEERRCARCEARFTFPPIISSHHIYAMRELISVHPEKAIIVSAEATKVLSSLFVPQPRSAERCGTIR